MRLFAGLTLLVATACSAGEGVANYGAAGKVWALKELDNSPFAAQATIEFDKAGRISGQAPCNRYSAQQKVPYPWFKIGPVMATKMACPDLMAEAAFLNALGEMSLSEVSGETLLLSNDAGRSMLFTALSSVD